MFSWNKHNPFTLIFREKKDASLDFPCFAGYLHPDGLLNQQNQFKILSSVRNRCLDESGLFLTESGSDIADRGWGRIRQESNYSKLEGFSDKPTGETEERNSGTVYVTGQLCACLPAWKGSFLAIISREGKGPIKLCECCSVVISSCPFCPPAALSSTFIYSSLASPASASWDWNGTLAGKALSSQNLKFPCPGQWRLATEKSGKFPRFCQRMDSKNEGWQCP